MPIVSEGIDAFISELPANGVGRSVAAAVLAYSTGDAFGVAYEFEPLVTPPIEKRILGKPDWPAGGVSDDTLLSLMTISCLSAGSPLQAGESFVENLRAAASELRGLGPTTRHALGIFVEEREVGIIGTTNGGMMRTALLALGFEAEQVKARQEWVRKLCAATHFKPESLYSALVMAELFALQCEEPQSSIDQLLARAIEQVADLPPEIKGVLRLAETFTPNPAGISLNPVESLLAVCWVVRKSSTVWQAFENAICLGGDTDTIAALSGALLALKNPASLFELEFVKDVNWDEIPEVTERISQLINNRSRA